MAADASEVLGAQQWAGTFVSPKGLTRRMAGGAAGGLVGAAIASRMGSGKHAPAFGNLGYLAVTETEIAIVKGKTGLMKPKVGTEVIERVPRSEIASSELEGGMLKAALRILFADGSSWEFEVPKVHRSTAEHVVKTLGGQVS